MVAVLQVLGEERTGSNLNAVIAKRLLISKINKFPVSLKRLITFMKGKVTVDPFHMSLCRG